ncbi:hypothetical protein ACIP8Z_05645 [Streptomyces sp. NPDC088553]|uniref:hypothetical protein n=1 Tax=Streptomyces sp. NPDC088553 TaxID=3365864 RepID=UPI003822264D
MRTRARATADPAGAGGGSEGPGAGVTGPGARGHPDIAHRLLRLLVLLGVFETDPDGALRDIVAS